jgi:hypothetical protein
VLAACNLEEPLPDPGRQLLVHAILDPAAQNQIITLDWSGAGHRGPIDSATVTITTPDGRVLQATNDVMERQFDRDHRRHGFYRIDLRSAGASLVPGGSYSLRVRTPDGTEASGTTTIPQASPVADDSTNVIVLNRSRDTVRARWPRVAGAKSYHVLVRNYSAAVADGAFQFTTYSVFADTSISLAGTARSFESDDVFEPRHIAIVTVCAVDDNYYTYYHSTIDPFAGAPPSRLTGAIGVFGAIVPVFIQRYDVR